MKLTKDNYYLFAAGLGVAGLGLAINNMLKTKKYRETMLGLKKQESPFQNVNESFGGFDDWGDEHELGLETPFSDDLDSPYHDFSDEVSLVSDFSSSYVDRGTSQIQSLLTSDTFINSMKDMGIKIEAKSINKEMIKNLLSAYGLFSLFMVAKGNALKIGVVGLAIYIAMQNKDKVQMLVNSGVKSMEKLTV